MINLVIKSLVKGFLWASLLPVGLTALTLGLIFADPRAFGFLGQL